MNLTGRHLLFARPRSNRLPHTLQITILQRLNPLQQRLPPHSQLSVHLNPIHPQHKPSQELILQAAFWTTTGGSTSAYTIELSSIPTVAVSYTHLTLPTIYSV
eukprot:TRINITY_DN4473_c0_g1_i1.p1 TRINITY_DN4473_c0_g1~~TRINITY_DN4473_c0_g1_i1.p1  ORF type:complete len:103 (-),score=9.67 TRINITY_DN4473_c0_g1_i1:61-369(-)